MIYNSDSILKILIDYANNDDNIRGILLEGSRAFGYVDEYSDYDIVFVTISCKPYFDGTIIPFLQKTFGEIAVMQTPDNGDPHDVYTHLIQFSNGIRIDLNFKSQSFLSRTPLESATAVLIDKDGRFSKDTKASDADFWIKCPSIEEFSNHCNEFWWCSPYVAKAVARGQTLHALELLSECVRSEYTLMLAWLAGVRNKWEHVNPGKHYTNIKNLLLMEDMHFYDALMNSYVGADSVEIRYALEILMTHYNILETIVANALNYKYNTVEAKKTMDFICERF